MKQEKLVKKPLPCSFFDIQGVQNWLDEMALQGLFLERLSYHHDRAVFRQGEPRPMRYRLDPVGKDWNDVERKENYARMGWEFVDAIPRTFYIFSCGDPEAPELHSGPATLSYALKTLIRRKIRDTLMLFGLLAALVGMILLIGKGGFPANLILMEYPLRPFIHLFLLILLAVLLLDCAVHVRRLRKTRRTLDDGLPLKAGRRHWRPNVPYPALYLPAILLFNLLNSYSLHYTTVEFLSLDRSALSHPWPVLAQLENAPPTSTRPERYSYMRINHSPAAPVQEHYTNSWGVSIAKGSPGVQAWYYQTSSPNLAKWLYRLEREELEDTLKDNNSYHNSSESIWELSPFVPQDHPAFDVLETASFRHFDLNGWAFAALRGNEVLLVRYSGSATLEDGLELFLDALSQ